MLIAPGQDPIVKGHEVTPHLLSLTQPSRKQEAIDNYYSSPKYCLQCGSMIQIRGGEKPSTTRLKKFCNLSCAGKYTKGGIPRGKTPSPRQCELCNQVFVPLKKTGRFCSARCAGKYTASLVSKDEKLRRGFGNSDTSKQRRRKQLETEEAMAAELRNDGWEIYSPTVVCDRIGVKNGFVYFIEFKPASNQKLRAGQKRICELIPGMYKVVVK